MTIRNRYLIALICVSALPLMFLGLVSYRISSADLISKTQSAVDFNVSFAEYALTGILTDLVESTRLIIENDAVMSALSKPALRDAYFSMGESQGIERAVRNIFGTQRYILYVALFSFQGPRYFYSSIANVRDFSSLVDQPVDSFQNQAWYRSMETEYGRESFVDSDVLFPSRNEAVFSVTKLLRSNETFEPVGFLVAVVRDQIFDVLFPVDPDSKLWALSLTVSNGERSEVILIIPPEAQSTIPLSAYTSNDDWIVSAKTNHTAGWTLRLFINRFVLLRKNNAIGSWTVVILIIALLIGLLSSIHLSSRLTRPLARLGGAIQQVADGESELADEFNPRDEIGAIGHSFVTMVRQNRSLQKQIISAREQQREAELKALYAQVNPHFLYNALDSIYWKASIHGLHDLAKMAEALSEFYRISLARGSELSTIAEEVRQLRHYLTIQSIRFGERLTFHISVDPEADEQQVLKLLMQPIVENAIVHGIEPRERGGHVEIVIRLTDSHIDITIKDDGVGVPSQDCLTHGFALNNIRQRLALYYGDQSKLSISSRPGQGTTVTLWLPCGLLRADSRLIL